MFLSSNFDAMVNYECLIINANQELVSRGVEPLYDVYINSVDKVLPELQEIFSQSGYMETSSSDLFSQFLRMGTGAKPIIAGYENQLIEYAEEQPESYAKIKDDIVILYPTPTLWSTHIYISLNEEGKKGIEALSDNRIQEIAWKKHGFRTDGCDIASAGFSGIPEQINKVIHMPDYETMKKIMDSLK